MIRRLLVVTSVLGGLLAGGTATQGQSGCQLIGEVCWEISCGAGGWCPLSPCTYCQSGIRWGCRNADTVDGYVELTIVDGVYPYTGWEVGTRFAGTLTGAAFDSENDDEWGTTVDEGLEVSQFGIVFRFESTGSSDTRKMVVESMSMQVPSFVHDETAPSATGLNVYSLRSDVGISSGTVDVTNGEVSFGKVNLNLTNSYYSSSDPAHLGMAIEGVMEINEGGTVCLGTGQPDACLTLVVTGVTYLE